MNLALFSPFLVTAVSGSVFIRQYLQILINSLFCQFLIYCPKSTALLSLLSPFASTIQSTISTHPLTPVNPMPNLKPKPRLVPFHNVLPITLFTLPTTHLVAYHLSKIIRIIIPQGIYPPGPGQFKKLIYPQAHFFLSSSSSPGPPTEDIPLTLPKKKEEKGKKK